MSWNLSLNNTFINLLFTELSQRAAFTLRTAAGYRGSFHFSLLYISWSGSSSSVTLILQPRLHASALDPNVSSEINSQLSGASYFLLLFYPESREELSLAFCTAAPLIGTRICKNGNLSKTCHKILKANHKLTNFFHSFKGNSNWNLHVKFYEDPWGHP